MTQFWIHLKNKPTIILLFILVFAILIRFWRIESLPNGLYWDEAAITYDAWGISIDGKDQWGAFLPLVFNSYGDGKLPFSIYFLSLLFKLGGFHIYWFRYLVAVFGIIMVLGTYFLSKKIFPKNIAIPILVAFLTASSSWAIHFSRFGLEASIGTCLMVWSVYFLYKSKTTFNNIVGVILLTLSAYTYHGNLLIAPMIFLIVGWKKIRTVLFIGLMIPLVVALTQSSWTRAEQTVFWNEPGYNLSVYSIGSDIFERIGAHLSPSFLILGNQSNLRQSVPNFFIIFPIELLVFIVGIFELYRESPKTAKWLSLGLLIGLLPSIIGDPSPHTIRAFNILPFIKMIEAYGIYWIYKKSKILSYGVGFIYLIFFGFFWRYYTTSYALSSAPDFQYGYKELMESLKQESNVFKDKYVITPLYGQPYIYTLLYWKISPPEYRAGGLANISYRIVNWPENLENTVYAGSPEEIPPNDNRVIKTIYFPDNLTPVWLIAR